MVEGAHDLDFAGVAGKELYELLFAPAQFLDCEELAWAIFSAFVNDTVSALADLFEQSVFIFDFLHVEYEFRK